MAIKRKTKQEKQIDDEIAKAFKKHFDHVVIPLLDIPKIYDQARAAIAAGATADETLLSQAANYKAQAETAATQWK